MTLLTLYDRKSSTDHINVCFGNPFSLRTSLIFEVSAPGGGFFKLWSKLGKIQEWRIVKSLIFSNADGLDKKVS